MRSSGRFSVVFIEHVASKPACCVRRCWSHGVWRGQPSGNLGGVTHALAFWKAVVDDHSDFLEGILELLESNSIRFCAIGGVAVNAYAPPVVTEDMDLVIAASDLNRARALMSERFETREFEPSFNVYDPGSRLQVQLQLGERFAGFVERAQIQEVMGVLMPVASPGDLLRARCDAALEPSRRRSKHFKDLADIARLLDSFPELEEESPPDVQAMLERR
jgi:hypothetical protein